MKKFEANYEKTFNLIVEVEAENKEEAKKIADKHIETKTRQQLLDESQESCFFNTYTDEVEE